ncbi:hypothetical protein [Sphingomonas sp. 3-13AW]|uniref:hypothetical protein n=1 Tax=Sphingomonas sp. 3-13AW TaxID=3050450 RepID=UPI003BB733C3
MNLCETTRNADGRVRYYAASRRITRARMLDIKHSSRLDTFQTLCRGGYTRQLCVATAER